MKSNLSALALGLAMLTLAGCVTPGIQPQVRPGTDLTRYHTFAILPVGLDRPANLPPISPATATAATKAATRTLEAKGLRPASEAEADLLVDLSGNAVSDPAHYMHQPVFTRSGMVNVYYVDSAFPTLQTQCTVVVELVDRVAQKVVWRAYQDETLLAAPGPETVAAIVKTILAAYPTQAGH